MIQGRIACLTVAALMLGCATPTDITDGAVYGATLTDIPDNATRDLIRTYVYDTLGADYIIDVDALTRTDQLTARDRGRGHAIGRPIPMPDMIFRLELTDTQHGPICRLVPGAELRDAQVLLLPPEVRCRLLPTEI